MPLRGQGYDVIGVSVVGDGPIRTMLHLPIDEGVQALYGLNGAGKSRLLGLIASALTGVRSGDATTDLHLRLDNPEAEVPGFVAQVAEAAHATVRQQQAALAAKSFADAAHEGPESVLAEVVARKSTGDIWTQMAALIDLGVEDGQHSHKMAEALYDAAYGGWLTLRAVGTQDRPAWDAFLSIADPELIRQWLKDGWDVSARLAELVHADKDAAERGIRELIESPALEHYNIDSAAAYRAAVNTRSSHWADAQTLAQVVPVMPLATGVSAEPVRVLGSGKRPYRADQATLDRVLSDLAPRASSSAPIPLLQAIDASGKAVFSTTLRVMHERVVRDAKAFVADVLLDPPNLQFRLGTPAEWLQGERPVWQYHERSTSEWLPIGEMSSARARWTTLATELASSPVDELPTVFVCDEPESGLHRQSEHRLARGLPALARRRRFCVLAATHSPSLLSSPEVHAVLVSRGPNSPVRLKRPSLSVVGRLSTEASAQELGVSVGDLWSLMRLVVVVEGVHDEWVFGSVLREDLDDSLASILPIHGGTRLRSLADAGAIMDGTDAQVLIVLDEMDNADALPVWTSVQEAVAAGDFDLARERAAVLRGRGDSMLYLHQFLTRAIDQGRLDRIHVHGLGLPDVICYLPANAVLNAGAEWSTLIKEWRASFGPNAATNIKKWLGVNRHLPTDPAEIDARVRDAADRMRREGVSIPEDLVGLGLRIRELSALSSFS